KDVSEDLVLIAFFNETHGHAGHWFFERNTGIHKGHRAGANRTHRRRTVRLEHFTRYAYGVWELGLRRHCFLKRALGQVSVTDFTTTNTSVTFRLTYGERWH